MDHLPFEDWILDKNEMNNKDRNELNQHLLECNQCLELKNSWNQVETLLFQTPMVAPSAGFSERFSVKMAIKKEEVQRKQSIKTLIAVGLTLFIITLLLVVLMVITYSAGEMIVGAVSTFTGFVQSFINFRNSALQIINNLPPILIIAGWLLLIVWGIILTPIWGITVWKVSKQGVQIK